MSKEKVLIERNPTVEEYNRLRQSVGWVTVDPEAAEKALSHALYSVCVTVNGDVVGCGRIIGDDGIYYYLQDVIVRLDCQGQGIGEQIMDALVRYLETHARKGAFAGLMCARGASEFFSKYGFARRPSAGPGMFRVWN